MSEGDRDEIVSESYRSRKRLMEWISSPFEAVEAIFIVAGVIAAGVAAFAYFFQVA